MKEVAFELGLEVGSFMCAKWEGRRNHMGKDAQASWMWRIQESSRAEVGGDAGEEAGNQVKWA